MEESTNTTKKDEKRGVKNLYKKCVLEGYKEIGVVTGDLKVTLGYITKHTIGDAEYQNNGFKPIPLRFFVKDLGISTKTASAHIHILEQLGFITVERGGKHEHDANRFTLTPEYIGLSKTAEKGINMEQPEQQQQAPEENNIDWKGKYDALYEKAGTEWRKKSKECKELQAKCDEYQKRLDKANQWKKGLGTYEFIESAVAFYYDYKESGGQPVEKLQAENKQLKAEIEKLTAENDKLRKCLDESLQEETPQEQHDGELQKYKNSLAEAVEENKRITAENAELKVKLEDKHLNDEKNRRIAELTNEAEAKDKEISQLMAEKAQQKRTYERQIEELTDDIRGKEATIKNKEAEIKNLKSDLKKATSGEVSLVVEPATPYGGNVKLIQCN
jgi:myosin heavy subunit